MTGAGKSARLRNSSFFVLGSAPHFFRNSSGENGNRVYFKPLTLTDMSLRSVFTACIALGVLAAVSRFKERHAEQDGQNPSKAPEAAALSAEVGTHD